MPKPVIFLAFANDRVEDAAYLRQLPQELNGIRHALKPAVQAGLCEVVERANATIEQVIDLFQDEYYRGRIAIFHYGGHANSYQLLLETATGKKATAHSEGLVGFLAQQRGLQLVFLNGCSSQAQADSLLSAGLPAVIGTSQSINDEVAVGLAIRFYKGLAQGGVLETAWQEAVEEVKIHKGTANMRDLFWEGAASDTSSLGELPWRLSIKQGAEQVNVWNLPSASDNPLYGLPEPAHTDLPEQPFRFLERYKREYAALFFGRGYYIRDLFDRATDLHASPIILLYGQSGVGKSSMLEAGLFPRLEQVCEVIYVRRNADKGLKGTMQEALGVGEGAAVQSAASTVADIKEQMMQLERLSQMATGDLKVKLLDALEMMKDRIRETQQIVPAQESTILEAWKRREKTSGKPLVILLDQVEEMYTKPAKHINKEREDSLAEIYDIFSDAARRPKGKLILSYRKEYHPEIEEALKALRLPREHVFLRKLDGKGIREVVAGLASTEALRRKYRLSIEEHLPEVIADDLLEDEDSPIAPILQILLTKMWLLTEQQQHRGFSIATYQYLKKEGILMGDFFKEQMEKLRSWNEEIERSGLALDVLHFHTTELGTAGTRSWEQLQQRYGHRQEVLSTLIDKFKELYLLTDTATGSSLGHDTLAPLVQQEFRKSDLPGQRAYRILEGKKHEFEINPNSLLGSVDVDLVEAGQIGMPTWSDTEHRLVAMSKARKLKQQAFNKKVRKVGIGGALLVAILAIFATYSWNEADKQKGVAETNLISSNIRRIDMEIDLERRNKEPQVLSKIQEVYNDYPSNPLTRNLVYKYMLSCNASRSSDNSDVQKVLTKDNTQEVSKKANKLMDALGESEGSQLTPESVTIANPNWKIALSGHASFMLHNIATGNERTVEVTIKDIGTIRSLSMHATEGLLLLVGSDGIVQMFDTEGHLIWSAGGIEEGYQVETAVFDEPHNAMVVKMARGDIYQYPLDIQQLLTKGDDCWR